MLAAGTRHSHHQPWKDIAMAKARRIPTKTTETKSQTTAQPAVFTCPECGKTFTRPASLGAHRSRAHGIAGTSKKRSRPGRRTRTTTPATTRRPTPRTRPDNRPATTVNRDALLQALFPNGLPAKEAVIRAANDWLDQAEQLARMS
jgi:uncharacterized C2H2 Zn-finger protein